MHNFTSYFYITEFMMRKITFIFIMAAVVLSGCQKPENNTQQPNDGTTPEITLNINGNLTLSSWAGTGNIPYTITNPAEDGEIYAECDAEWIDGFNYDTDGQITFTYQANNGEVRNTIVTVGYKYGDGLTAEEKQINVIQETYTFNITVSDIKPTSARIISSCNEDITWTSGIMTKEEFENTAGGKEGMPDYFAKLLKEVTWIQYGYSSFEEFIQNYLFKGNSNDDYTETGLPQETPYITYAVGMDYNGEYTTEFYWGPEFTTGKVEINKDVTFDISVAPKAVTADITVTPSDPSVLYLVSAIDASEYDETMDESIMIEICNNYGQYITNYTHSGTQTVLQSNMEPSSEYYAIAFGVDIASCAYNTLMSKKPFTTTGTEESGPYASARRTNWWDINDLVAYNPEYEAYRNATRPMLVSFDFEFNEAAESAYWIMWYGDVTTEKYENVYQMTLDAGPAVQYKGDPSPIHYMRYDEPTTLCVIARDADGNPGDMFMQLITLRSDEGKSTDFELFDQYLNALVGE